MREIKINLKLKKKSQDDEKVFYKKIKMWFFFPLAWIKNKKQKIEIDVVEDCCWRSMQNIEQLFI